MLRRGGDRVTGRDSRNQKLPYTETREREREGQREKENARVWERTERASERTRKATSCVNLCTQRVACDSNTGRFFPPASSPPPPPPLSSSSPLSNSHERPADLQKTTERHKLQATRMLLASRLRSWSAKAERSREETRGNEKETKGGRETTRRGGRECRKIKNGERVGEGERIFVQNLAPLICIIYKGVRCPIPHSFDPRPL